MLSNRPTLRSKLRKAIITPSVTGLLLTVFFAFVLAWWNHRNTIQVVRANLAAQATVLSRRVSAELLIGSRGAPIPVLESLSTELGLETAKLHYTDPPCIMSGADTCEFGDTTALALAVRVPGISNAAYISVSKGIPSLWVAFPFSFLLWTGIPIFLVLGYAIYLQQRQLRKYFLQPIQSIIDKTESGAALPSYWPLEFVKLQRDLDDAFHKRDQAIIGQIASGVIHDLKTLLQPISGATQLSVETEDLQKKSRNLDMLLRACERNLPKMQNMLESILDGNREIRLQSRSENLVTTIASAVRTANEAANRNGTVLVETMLSESSFQLIHDPAQLERALSNLIKNGIESAALKESNRKVRISVAEIAKQSFKISIEDSGDGLPMPFDQLLGSRKTNKTRGTGLGLLISQKIIEAHRGQIEGNKSKTLHGAEFTVTLGSGGAS